MARTASPRGMDERTLMTASSVGGDAASTTPTIRVPLAGWLLAAVAAVVIYLVAQDNGLVLAGAAEFVHEFTHDGRHALGVPCH